MFGSLLSVFNDYFFQAFRVMKPKKSKQRNGHASCHRLAHYYVQASTLNSNGLAELAAQRVCETYLLVESQERCAREGARKEQRPAVVSCHHGEKWTE